MSEPPQESESKTRTLLAAGIVLLLVGAALVPLAMRDMEERRRTRANERLQAVKAAFLGYYADTGRWPCGWDARAGGDRHADLPSYECLRHDDGTAGWNGPYLAPHAATNERDDGGRTARAMLDPWGQPLRVYQQASSEQSPRGAIVIYSRGLDRAVDTAAPDLLAASPSNDDLVLLVSQAGGG